MTAHVRLRRAKARGCADLARLVALYDGAARWMRSRGIEQWQPGGKDEEHFRAGRGVVRGDAAGAAAVAVHGTPDGPAGSR
ncbi:hypothetical protein [Streptomyces albidochromogenes]|uniref:GNAT family N-acetyltransferase n=1 Tax=Streptomyces albidochromogenes TaxID=329524 RepID=A0ABW6FQ74_9ACTN